MRLPLFVEGEGPAVVLVHGRGEAHHSWDLVLPHLRGFRAYRVDLVGFGTAPAPLGAEHYSVAACCADLVETLRELQKPFALVGHSFGGMVACRFAAHHRHRLAALVGVSTAAAYPYSDTHFPEQRALLMRLANLAEQQGMPAVCAWLGEQGEVDDDAMARWRALPAHVLTASIRQNMHMEDHHVGLSSLEAPTMVVVGERDAAYLPWCQRLAATVPKASLFVVPDTGHAPHVEATEVFGTRLSTFLHAHL